MNRIVLFSEKNYQRIFDASTDELLRSACEKVIRDRLEENWYHGEDADNARRVLGRGGLVAYQWLSSRKGYEYEHVTTELLEETEITVELEKPNRDYSREYTTEEIRDEFLTNCVISAVSWSKTANDPKGMCMGLLHSILCIIDGVSSMPQIDMYTIGSAEDIVDAIENESKYYPEDPEEPFNDCMMHELLPEYEKNWGRG